MGIEGGDSQSGNLSGSNDPTEQDTDDKGEHPKYSNFYV